MSIPKHLKESSKIYEEVTLNHDLEAQQLATLQVACEAYDRSEEARFIIQKEGITFNDKNGYPKKHPAVAIKESAESLYNRSMRELALDYDTKEPPGKRPVRTKKYYG